jgi:hypothetical protein
MIAGSSPTIRLYPNTPTLHYSTYELIRMRSNIHCVNLNLCAVQGCISYEQTDGHMIERARERERERVHT